MVIQSDRDERLLPVALWARRPVFHHMLVGTRYFSRFAGK